MSCLLPRGGPACSWQAWICSEELSKGAIVPLKSPMQCPSTAGWHLTVSTAWGLRQGVRCSPTHSGPEPSLPALALPGTPSPLLLHQECKTPRLVEKIQVKVKPSWHMGLFKLATAWLSPSAGHSAAVMSLVPCLSVTKGLHSGLRSSLVPLFSGCSRRWPGT